MTNETFCGYEEHVHTDECYETTLICELEEVEGHTHDESCYDEEGNLICELDECEPHTHTDECYEKTLICEIPEHIHTVECMINLNADVEDATVWEATLPVLTGDLRTDVINIAYSQLGYAESTANYSIGEDGVTHNGYTRYGAWYGNEYGSWDSMFAAFCLYYAGNDEAVFPVNSGAYAWAVRLSEVGAYAEASETIPSSGDVVFFDTDFDGRIDRSGIVVSVGESAATITVIEGDYSAEEADTVDLNTYLITDSTISGYGILPATEEATEEIIEEEIESEEVDLWVEEETTEETVEETSMLFYTASDSGVTVSVIAPQGALPDNATLAVSLLDESSSEYQTVAEAVGYDSESEDTGMAALDITFYDEFGFEIEPVLPVTVSVDITEIIPEGITADTIEVTHLTDTTVETVETLVETVTDSKSDTAMVVFETESFSTFTLTWSYYDQVEGNGSVTATVNVYDTSGNSIDYTSLSTITFSPGDVVTLADLCAVSGYNFSKATVSVNYEADGGQFGGSQTATATDDDASTITYTKNTQGRGGTLTIDGTQYSVQSINSFTINLYFEADVTDGVYITDNISADGTLVATLIVNGETIDLATSTEYTVTWYKAQPVDNGDLTYYNSEQYDIVDDSHVLYSNGTAVNVALDDGGLCYYKAVVTDSSGTEIGYDVMWVPYADEIMNSSFEYPVGGGSGTNLPDDNVPFWSTTASDGYMEIAKYTDDNSSYGTQGIYAGGSQAAAGDQFAELNANDVGSLYQDVLTISGENLYWSLYHRARTAAGTGSTYDATDTMYVVIMSEEDAQKILTYADSSTSDQQTVLTNMISSVLSSGSSVSGSTNATLSATGTYSFYLDGTWETVTVNVWQLTTYNDDDGEWTYYYGNYEVPTSQYLTRFFFVSGATQYGGTTSGYSVGNLIDNANFSQEITYTIEYWVWDDSQDKYVLQTAYTETGEVDPGTNVYAKYLSTFSDYGLIGSITGTSSGGSNPADSDFDSTTTTGIRVQNGRTYLSLYLGSTVITVIKDIEGLTEDELDEIGTYQVTFTIADTSGNTKTLTVTVGDTGSGSNYISGLDPGTYTIIETNYPTSLIDDSYVWSGFTVEGATYNNSSDAYEFTVDSSTTSLTITYTNTYESAGGPEMPETGSVGTISCTLVGLLLICSASYLLYKKRKRKCKWRWNI